MKANFPIPCIDNIEISKEFQEKLFSIGDFGLIFDVLRNKMYSNPILAICREISSNARDAHREVGTPNVPIQIYLPTNIDPFYKIKDFGPGIGPDRIENIFIKYGVSTKREDNIQTGFFGLGSKTPFSYSDTFNVITCVNGIKYNYMCFIDETKMGKISLLSEETTDEPNGTEISIPVKSEDFHRFKNYTEQATRHWDVKPILKGDSFYYESLNKFIEGDKWAIVSTHDWNRYIKLIIDGIEYPLDLSSLESVSAGAANYIKGNLYLYFDNGELSLSANREQVYLDAETKEKILERLEKISIEIKDKVQKAIEEQKSLWDAQSYYKNVLPQIFADRSILEPIHWRNIELQKDSIYTECQVYTFTKGVSYRYNSNPDRIKRSSNSRLTFEQHSMLFIDDLHLEEVTIKHVKKIFENNKNIKVVQVICPNAKITESVLNDAIHLHLMNPIKLSTITKFTKRVSSRTRLVISKFSIKDETFNQTTLAAAEDDTNHKVLVFLRKEYSDKKILLKNGSTLYVNQLIGLAKTHNEVSFYGIDSSTPQDRIDDDFDDYQSFDQFLETVLSSSNREKFIEAKNIIQQNGYVDSKFLKSYSKFSSKITQSNSLFLRMLSMNKYISDCFKQSKHDMLGLYEKINGEITSQEIKDYLLKNPDKDLNHIRDLYFKEYPLMNHLSYYYDDDDVIDAIIHYINCVDVSGNQF